MAHVVPESITVSVDDLIANIIAWPVAYHYLRQWLDGYAYRISLSPFCFLIAGAAALLSAWATVVAHTLRLAHTSPVRARYEYGATLARPTARWCGVHRYLSTASNGRGIGGVPWRRTKRRAFNIKGLRAIWIPFRYACRGRRAHAARRR